jgi:hypothetical protein
MAINIKPSHEGIFEMAAKRAGKGTQEFAREEKHSDNPARRKQATFALNAKKWNH